MAGAVAVVDCKMTKLENSRVVIVTNLKALGVLGIYLSTLPSFSWEQSMMITMSGKVVPVSTVKISHVDAHVLEVDVERAWKELDLEAGWSNEVEVKIYINPSH